MNVYNFNDTIAAVSSPSNDQRVIIRLTGPQVIDILHRIFTPTVPDKAGITTGSISLNSDIALDAIIYLFRQPHSYTGDELAEIHLWANTSVTETLMEQLLAFGVRPASPGEFTARAYLNNKIDLAQAEAVNEVITASNTFQLAAAENLLAGRLGRMSKETCESIIEALSRLEAGFDFSTEDIESQNKADTISAIGRIVEQLRELLAGSVRCESTIDLPSVGIAGVPNAGKSTLLNKLLGRRRSIVSDRRKTTRDVLTSELTLSGCRCILFDCAGLIVKAETILDELAQQAAIEALRNTMVVIFCVDAFKNDWAEDLAIRRLINPSRIINVATKTDLLSQREIVERISRLRTLFDCDFLPVSAHNDTGIGKLKAGIAERVITATSGHSKYGVALTARHRQSLTSAVENLNQAISELRAGNDEVAAMFLRAAHNGLGNIDQHNISEDVLGQIFSRFCIGK